MLRVSVLFALFGSLKKEEAYLGKPPPWFWRMQVGGYLAQNLYELDFEV